MLASLFTALLAVSPALAQDDGATVFVSEFQARNNEAAALASLLPRFLEQKLSANAAIYVVPLSTVGDVHDMPADIYLDSCPPGSYVGCAYVVGETAAADYAVAGSVQALVSGTRVAISIVDVNTADEVVSFQVELGAGDDEIFADRVASVLVGVIEGEIGQENDIRDLDTDDGSREEARKQRLGMLLDDLSRELGDVSTLTRTSPQQVERPKLTMDDIADRMQTEGVKPWERVGMQPGEYLRYKNSGHSLRDWKIRALGRKGQLVLRPFLGFVRAPLMGEYYGRYAREVSGAGFEVAESFSYQAVTGGSGFWVGGSVGYGLLPELDVGLVGGMATGRFTVEIRAETVGETPGVAQPTEYSNKNLFIGPRVLFAAFPTQDIRPVLAGEVVMWKGTAVDSHIQVPQETGSFPASTLWMVTAVPGVELAMTRNLDFFVQVPVSAVVAGGDVATRHEGGGALDDLKDPPSFAPFSAGLSTGLQVRLFGGKLKEKDPRDTLMEMDEP